MHKPSLIAASIFGSTAVIIGAFAAHALKKILPAEALQTIETAVRYQMYHALVLLALCSSKSWISAKSIKRIFSLLVSGILCFSGSIYLLIFLKSYHIIGLRGIGIITPIGGILLILAWILLFIEAYKYKEISAK